MGENRRMHERMCVGCRQMKGKDELIRIVRTGEGEFAIDLSGKMDGRGAYVCKNPDCLALAVKNHGFERSFKRKLPREISEELEKEMSVLAG